MLTNEMLGAKEILSNPWNQLASEPPFILEEDLPIISAHNNTYRGSPFEVVLDIMPEPFVGSPAAPLWLLSLNPGFERSDLEHGQAILSAQRDSLRLAASDFWYLDEQYQNTGGYRWWSRNLGYLCRTFGVENVRRSVFCVEYFPYHSVKFKPTPKQLPSINFTAELVRWGCSNNKSFIFVRAKRRWLDLVPTLNAARSSDLWNHRNVWVTPDNLVDATILDHVFHNPRAE